MRLTFLLHTTLLINTVNVLIIEPVKNNYFSRNNKYMGVIKEGVLPEAGSIIGTLTVVWLKVQYGINSTSNKQAMARILIA